MADSRIHDLAEEAAARGRRAPVQVSFEFFPPNDVAMERTLWASVQRLAPLGPRFVSVTYGADGSTRARTHNVVMRVLNETALTGAPHLTCIGATREEILEIARNYWAKGVRHLVALRGDPVQGGGGYRPHPGGFDYAADLVRGLKSVADFDISVAAYPETHPEAPSASFDLDNLKRKVDAGADRCITQFFFDVGDFLRLRDRAAAAGVHVPIVPGILPVSNFGQVVKFAGTCGARVPAWLAALFEGLDDDLETRRMIAATVAGDMCRRLEAEGVSAFHFYTLNRADLTYAICHLLGIRPTVRARTE
jgi:methylenetetrahydrofolate reductase (NADPH)